KVPRDQVVGNRVVGRANQTAAECGSAEVDAGGVWLGDLSRCIGADEVELDRAAADGVGSGLGQTDAGECEVVDDQTLDQVAANAEIQALCVAGQAAVQLDQRPFRRSAGLS